MTERQKEIFNIIKKFIKDNGYAPTVREICKLANLASTSSGFNYLALLEKQGYISMVKNSPRTIRILREE